METNDISKEHMLINYIDTNLPIYISNDANCATIAEYELTDKEYKYLEKNKENLNLKVKDIKDEILADAIKVAIENSETIIKQKIVIKQAFWIVF